MEKRIRTQGGIMQEQDGCEVEMKESWKVCEGLQGWLRKRWWWWWSCDSTFNIWLEKGVLGKTRNRPSFSLPRGGARNPESGPIHYSTDYFFSCFRTPSFLPCFFQRLCSVSTSVVGSPSKYSKRSKFHAPQMGMEYQGILF